MQMRVFISQLVLLMLLSLIPVSITAQVGGKQEAGVSPATSVGNVSQAVHSIVSNRFESLLSKSYRLVSREQYKKAEDQVFASLDIEQCTEAYCIRKIQEILQVERLFFLSISQEEKLIQLNITLVKNEDRLIEESVCDDCSIPRIYEQLGELVEKIVNSDLGSAGNQLAVKRTGKILISSDPTDANIILDGNRIPFTTETLLEGISAGQHTITVFKDKVGASRTFQLMPDEIKEIGLTLSEFIKVRINSDPIRADVYIDGRKADQQTPVTVEMESGWHQIEFRHSDFPTVIEHFLADHSRINLLETNLQKKSVRVTLEMKPADSLLSVNGNQVGEPEKEGFEAMTDTRTITFSMPPGTHKIKLSHPQATGPIEKNITLVAGNEQFQDTMELQLKRSYVDDLIYLDDMSGWRWKYRLSGIGTLLFAAYAYSEYQNAVKANEEYNSAYDQMMAAPSARESETYAQKTDEYRDKIETHNKTSQTAAIVSLCLFGLTTLIWLDEPEKPQTISVIPYWTPAGKMGLTHTTVF